MDFIVTAPPYNGPRFTTRSDALSGVHLGAALRQACEDAHAQGGGVVYVPAGWYLCDRGFDVRALSNVHIKGAGVGLTNIVAASSLDGRDNYFYNDVFMGLNFTAYDPVKGGYPWHDVGISDMSIHCELQNPNGIVLDGGFGRSLAAIELMNIDNAFIKRVRVHAAFGNGLLITSADPRLRDGNGVRVGVLNPVIEDVDFIGVLRGPLPQYPDAQTPAGITGTAIQIGAAVGGRITRATFKDTGGPIIDRFNCDGLLVEDIYAEGFLVAPVGADPAASNFSQAVNHIRSDFGLINSTLRNVVMRNGGGVYDKGLMAENYFTGNVRTPGPQKCTYDNIKIETAKGRLQIPSPTILPSGQQYGHRRTGDVYTYPVEIQFSEWEAAGITVSLKKNGSNTWTPIPISSHGTVVIHFCDQIAVNYMATTWNWAWYLCPNAEYPGIHIDGGSTSGHIGVAKGNTFSNISIDQAGLNGLKMIDSQDNGVENCRFHNLGIVSPKYAVVAFMSLNEAGAGSTGNTINHCSVSDDRDTSMVAGLWFSDSRSSGCRILDNSIGTLNPAFTIGVLSQNAANYHKGNTGPGSPSSNLGGSPNVPASGSELVNSYNFDCFVSVSNATAIYVGRTGAMAPVGSTNVAHVPHGESIRLTHGGNAAWVWSAVP